MNARPELDQWLNYYECPECDYHFYDVWHWQVEMLCERCATRNISPTESWQLLDGGIENMAAYEGSFQPLVDEEGCSPVDDEYL